MTSIKAATLNGKVVTRNYNGFNWQTDYVSADVSLWFRYLPNGLRYSKQKRTDSTCTVTTHHWDDSDIVMDVSQNGTVKGNKTGDGSLSCNLVIKVLVYDYPHQKVSSKRTGLFYFCNTVNFVINIADG